MPFRCDTKDCGWVSPVMTVRCRGKCKRAGTMRMVAEGDLKAAVEPASSASHPVKPVAPVTAQPHQPASPHPAPPKASLPSRTITGTVPPAKSGSPELVIKPVLSKTPQKPPVSVVASPPVHVRSDAGRPRSEEILKAFKEDGLWLRSVQFKNCQCLTEPDITLDPKTRSVAGLFCDAWTYAHPTISQYLFQLHPTEGKRAVALIVDWTKTADRYVDYAVTDRASNKTFEANAVARLPEETQRDMATMRKTLSGISVVGHNEVRTCQIRKDALVGLIWSPILLPTALSDGGVTWEDTKSKFEKFVLQLQSKGVAKKGLPIFTYEVSSGMTLSYIDFIG